MPPSRETHYDLIKDFFKNDAADKKGYYNVTDVEELKSDISRRRMWKVYTSMLDKILQYDPKLCSVVDVGCGMGNFLHYS